MSVSTPGGISWSTARTSSTVTPCARMIATAFCASASVFDGWGERFSVQLMTMARRSEKSGSGTGWVPSCHEVARRRAVSNDVLKCRRTFRPYDRGRPLDRPPIDRLRIAATAAHI